MKNLLFILYCLVSSLEVFAQTLNPVCPSDFWRQKHLQSVDFQKQNDIFEQNVLEVFQGKKGHPGTPEQTRTVPVVVHIIHDNGPENISDAEVQQAIQWLNQALSNQGIFDQGSGANTEIQLCLAQRTPTGEATNGITRDQSALTELQMETQDVALKNLNRWKPKDYLNIWLVRSICSVTYGCNVYGYANYPFAHGSNIDGIVIEAAYLSDSDKIRGLAHETGHYFGLYHTFEGGCTNNNCLLDGDRVCDTPPDQSTVGIPCSELVSTCSTDTQSGPFSSDQPDMTWNYLDYGHLECFHDYTPDQSTRMNASLDGIRHSLLESKGCLPPCPGNPVASFIASDTTVNIGETINFQSTSQNAASYQWTVDGVNFGNQINASYTFSTLGTHSVTLTALPGNTTLCDPDQETVAILVVCPVQANFSLSNLSPEQNDTVQVTNQTQNATQANWYLNLLPLVNSPDSIVFTAPGTFEVQLIASNGLCADTASVTVEVHGFCVQKTFDYEFKNLLPPDVVLLTKLTDGNLIMESFSNRDLIKITPYGKIVWHKGIPYALTPGLASLNATNDGGFIIANNFNDGVTEEAPQVTKYNSNGDLQWSKKIVSDSVFFQAVKDVAVLPDGFILAGTNLLVKLDPSGEPVWAKKGLDAIQIRPYPDGGYIILDVRTVTRINAMGQVVWKKFFPLDIFDSAFQDIVVLPDGQIFVAGYILTDQPNRKGLLLKLDENGDTEWVKYYREVLVSRYEFTNLILDSDGNLVLAGWCLADTPSPVGLQPFSIIIKVDLDGNIVWSRHFPGRFLETDLISIPGGGLVRCGMEKVSNVFSYVRVIKTDNDGRLQSCEEEPHTVHEIDYTIDNIAGTLSLSPYTATTVADLPIWAADLSIQIDTLCAPACQVFFEICNNNIDDDGDGLFDCLDTECSCSNNPCNPKISDKWYFGDKAGIDFSVDPPQLLSGGKTELNEGYSSICDPLGHLLFYTDGLTVYNRFHTQMPNGAFADISHSLIIPHPGQANLYYLFSVGSGGEFTYSVIDMTLDEGRGDIQSGQKALILNQNCKKLAAVVSCGFEGYWLVVNKGTNQFLAFRINQNGLQTTPVTSTTTLDVWLPNQLKISPDGAYIACTGRDQSTGKVILVLYDFNDLNTGSVLNPQLIESFASQYETIGVEFSPNSKYLYCSGNFQGDYKLRQYDLEAGTALSIRNSAVHLAHLPGMYPGLLQLAPNGKIYFPTQVNNAPLGFKLDVIHTPDKAGPGCKYQHEGLDLSALYPPGGTVLYTLPNMIAGTNRQPRVAFAENALDTICYLNVLYQYELKKVPCDFDSITWQITGLNALLFPLGPKVTLDFKSSGAGKLIVNAYTPCGIAVDTLDIYVSNPSPSKIDFGPDITVCQNGVITLHAGSGFTHYLWSNNTSDSTTTTLQPGRYWVKAWDLCGNLYSDTILISVAPNSVLNLGEIPTQCPGFTQSFQRPAGFSSWQWAPADFLSCTNCPTVTIQPDQNAVWTILATTADGCISVDTLNATIRDTLPIQLDTFACANISLSLFGATLPPDTTVQFFFPRAGITCDTLWTVNVMQQDNPLGQIDVNVCPDAYFNFHGILLPPDTSMLITVSHLGECDSLITVSTHRFPAISLQLPQDTTIKIGASVLLETQIQGANPFSLQWTPAESLSCADCPDPLATPFDTLTYFLSVTDVNGCTGSGSVTLRVQEICRVQVPSAFTPNGDGANDVFKPICDPCVKTVLQWRIFNRWGQNVFSQFNFPPADPSFGWDGRDQEGKAQASDVYIWTLEVEYFDGRREQQQKEVTLIR